MPNATYDVTRMPASTTTATTAVRTLPRRTVSRPAVYGGETFSLFQLNVLADRLSFKTDNFVASDPVDLSWTQRSRLLLEEVSGWNADIVCLHEIDDDKWAWWKESMSHLGYEGVFHSKSPEPFTSSSSTIFDGSSIFHKTDVFAVCSTNLFRFSNTPTMPPHVAQAINQQAGASMQESCTRNGSVGSRLPGEQPSHEDERNNKDASVDGGDGEKQPEGTGQGCIVRVLQSLSSDHKYIIATTHLKAKPQFESVRLSQARQLLRRVKTVVDFTGLFPVILAGDFNAAPESPTIRWISGQQLCPMRSAYQLDKQEHWHFELKNRLDYTTWKIRPDGEIKRVIDYVWYSHRLEVLETAMPLVEGIPAARLPCSIYPSGPLLTCHCLLSDSTLMSWCCCPCDNLFV
eukprot:GHVQ01017950.1.p1 GENE.GHVQ01017950.1~~GHVQ01017950.1.p1  ORF type:complete len:403 (-),score=51.26 GHVQ01017950.1:673-1881(-)